MRVLPSSIFSQILPLLLLTLTFTSLSSASSTPQSFLSKGFSHSVEDESDLLVSPDKTFTSGFYKVGTNAFSFSIWFTHSTNKNVIWSANRDQPVNGHGSRISMERDGNLDLSDVDGSSFWNTDTRSTKAEKIELLNTGNLVLKDPDGIFLWQSFDYPTDTLVPSQPMTKGTRLVSAKGKDLFSSGYFSFFFDSDNVLKLLYDGPEISSLYWPNPDFINVWQAGRTNYNSSRYAVLDGNGRFFSSDRLDFNASDSGPGIRRRLTMDYDGNLRLYSLNALSGSWLVTWQALAQQCLVHGSCGRNGVCVYTPNPTCTCPQGFEMSDPNDWSHGCKHKFNRSCNSKELESVEILHTDFYGFDLKYTDNISFESCKNKCLEDCSCDGFGYRLEGTGVCYPKSALFNGYQSPSFSGSIYIKVAKGVQSLKSSVLEVADPICSSAEAMLGSSDMYRTSRPNNYIYIYWFVLAIGGIEILFIGWGWWYMFREHRVPKSVEDGYRAISNQFRRFTYSELKKATKKFKEELGRGASGVVYKGVLGEKKVVAVKKLADAIQGKEEFWAEVSTIGKIYHMNLVRMWGYCAEYEHRLLVYEYVHNGSLDKHLFSNGSKEQSPTTPLGWEQRFKIAVGTAKGLAYLHNECLEWVIHCDVKPENILLDSDFEPKIADFGLAKLSQRGGPGSNFSTIRGTKGYMAPEWALNLPITAKVDVYSFGVVLLELVTGSRLSNWVMDGEEEQTGLRMFAREAKKKVETRENSWIFDLVDPSLKRDFDCLQAVKMVKVGLSCVEEERSKRHTMDMIVQNLLASEDDSISYISAK